MGTCGSLPSLKVLAGKTECVYTETPLSKYYLCENQRRCIYETTNYWDHRR